MAHPVNLQELAYDRSTPARPQPRRKYVVRYIIPAFIVIAFTGLMAWSMREQFLPAQEVTITPVLLSEAELQQAGEPVFQAAGWIEPRPMPTLVTALVEGVVQTLLVIEGQEVSAGQELATLIDIDARLALDEARATQRLRQAEVDLAQANLVAARQSLEQPVHLEAAVAEAESELAKITTEADQLPFAEEGAKARLQIAQQELEGKQSVGEAIAARAVQRAQSEYDSAVAALNEIRQRQQSIGLELESSERKCAARRKQLELKTDEHRRAAEAEAELKMAKARLEQAGIAVSTGELRLERMIIRSPAAGRVLAVHARPGQRLMGMAPSSELDASTVVSLYDPRSLQVRADVRLEDVHRTTIGQPVEITTAATSSPIRGEVVAITSQADIQKNTLQVKVAIHEPPPVIKPEMLVQVTFLAPQSPTTGEPSKQLRQLIPRALVRGSREAATVWVADLAHDAARLRSVRLGRAGTAELVEVVEGLEPTDKLIVAGREQLADGQRIQVVGEDNTLNGDSMSPVASAEISKHP